ncbi:HAD family hydrolase [Pseudomonas fulva]|nr:HAD family hydrolase [Pseudomonas fulva]
MNRSHKALYEFGYGFLGPILNYYIREIQKRNCSHMPVCLAREGWIIYNILDKLRSKGLADFKATPIYLKVSRTVLFRSQLGNPSIVELGLMSKFSGSVLELLLRRFGLQLHEAYSLLPVELLDFKVNLPEDMDAVATWFEPHNERMHAYVKPTRDALMYYFESEGLTKAYPTALFLDLGYAGTIQKIITSMIGQNSEGLYFITTASGEHKVGPLKASMTGVFKENVQWSTGYLMLERSLLLESLMTSPDGQLVDVRLGLNNDLQFFHGRLATPQKNYQDLQTIFDGATNAVIEGYELGLTYTLEELEVLFAAYATSPSAIPSEAFHLFNIDDDFSGNGVINPTQLFGLH